MPTSTRSREARRDENGKPNEGYALVPELRPLTVTGVVERALVPLPNWPKVFWPQHLTVPSVDTAHTPISPVQGCNYAPLR